MLAEVKKLMSKAEYKQSGVIASKIMFSASKDQKYYI